MNGNLISKTFISKTITGFPEYLDFKRLRSEGIDYLGKLSGQLWTDHNVHDPGITILEMLVYAILDLGYRTNLPIEDILARDPEDSSIDNNFFTPSQILGCNPLTIIDYRKLLVDIEGVRNAWIETKGEGANKGKNRTANEYVDGLYHIILDLENVPSGSNISYEDYKKEILNNVKTILQDYRNLCEDFSEPWVYEKQTVGVVASIELDENVNTEEVYINIVTALREFITPSPQFYTLAQLLDKKKTIVEIFEGRPYNLSQSNGFVDTDDFEKLRIRKEVHTSDLFNIVNKISGVFRVENLELRTCDNNNERESIWKFKLKPDHVPEFSIDCSDLQFVRNGIPVYLDSHKYKYSEALIFRKNGIARYHLPSPYLDLEIPKGKYRNDLDDYFSIQNEFPAVYGIGEGDLPDDVSYSRKAHALQLKGYLLFFDQLLANYLTQLKNIRGLFSFSSPNNEDLQQTYFGNRLTSVPDLQKLIRLKIDEKEKSKWGTEGTTLVFPVNKTNLLSLKESGEIKNLEIEKFDRHFFSSANESEIALQQVKNDLFTEQYDFEQIVKEDGSVFYYILTSSQEFALISNKYFNTESDARNEAVTIQYIGSFEENFHSFYLARKKKYSFSLDFNLAGYAKYLQLIIEDKKLYRKRRQGFLDHLLARFAEKFTDYAMLSFRFLEPHILESNEIIAKEKFLTHYSELSSNRGKGYNYQNNGWGNENISGFEKRFKGLAGIENWQRRSLCNFEVAPVPTFYRVELDIGGVKYFRVEELYDDEKNALNDAKELFSELSQLSNYSDRYNEKEGKFEIVVRYGDAKKATFLKKDYKDKASASEASIYYSTLFYNTPADEDIIESRKMYRLKIIDCNGIEVRKSKLNYTSKQEAIGSLKTNIKLVNDTKIWERGKAKNFEIGTLYPEGNPDDKHKYWYIDLDSFQLDIKDAITDKSAKYKLDLSDNTHKFKFSSLLEYRNKGLATIEGRRILGLLPDKSNYKIIYDRKTKTYKLFIESNKQLVAENSKIFKLKAEAQKLRDAIIVTVGQYRYTISDDPYPIAWKYRYKLGYEEEKKYIFESTREYQKESFAREAAKSFSDGIDSVQIRSVIKAISLVPQNISKLSKGDLKGMSACILLPDKSNEDKDYNTIKKDCVEFLHERAAIVNYAEKEAQAFTTSIRKDEKSEKETLVYRLVDKDNMIATVRWSTNAKQFSDEQTKSLLRELINKSKQPYDYLEICLGGDIIRKRKDNNNVIWYHYQLKCRNQFYSKGEFTGKELILFESVDGFSCKEEAEKAFNENYLSIFKKALDPLNYGADRFISVKEIYVNHIDECAQINSKVFIPKYTLNELGDYDDAAIREVIKIAKTYPIRLTDNKTYKFYLQIHEGDLDYWESSSEHTTPKDAMKQFLFFMVLLKYPGNYLNYYDSDTCEYKIFIREVLAESRERFSEEEIAWSTKGVQKFIGVSQTAGAFHKISKGDCYSYYVACKNLHIIHPTEYKTIKERDDQINRLHKAFQKWEQPGGSYLNIVQEKSKINFLSEEIDFDTLSLKEITPADELSESLISQKSPVDLLHEIKTRGFYIKERKKDFGQFQKENLIISQRDEPGESYEKLTEKISKIAYYFPIVKETNVRTGVKDKYKIRIKLPDYNKDDTGWQQKPLSLCDDDTMIWDPCPPAWESECEYDTVDEALSHYKKALELLSNPKNYRPTYDCKCASYGISLHYDPDDYNQPSTKTEKIQLHDSNEIVAYNPQCYSSPEMACESIERAKKLINSEGLHLVEHILLRDLNNNSDSRNFDNITNCEFTWYAEDDDPCSTEEDIQFIPGEDPLSFIASVTLPAWPERFRTRENRLLIENMLYREVPAHVLLRILWLAPHDLMCFEKYYKNWIRSKAGKKICNDTYDTSLFKDFLFKRNFECFDNIDYCDPCKDSLTEFKARAIDKNNISVEHPHNINHIFNWRHQSCDDYEFDDCDKPFIETSIKGSKEIKDRRKKEPTVDEIHAAKKMNR